MPLKITLSDGTEHDASEDVFSPESIPGLRAQGGFVKVSDDLWVDPQAIIRVRKISERDGSSVSAPSGPRGRSRWIGTGG